ncbi:putative L-lactate dehydrogenase [Babesia bovis T2Bo]|uniref:L-lactate dehydrogenase n=1 Tax=Babesia bovis TaxID=5865 RepID=Q7Z0X7_BABBO|nr:putative L-lactate dehydrogenase [Babesia bovis T2Bo]EDO07479.1 putative L-lactate dehydrogenase [Babesia bovis T2Bo]BAC77691.1 L-lactate dehydrogenase [Babesia bovis]BAN65278.1 lactate dehydrogenase [Babesia bovis]|eukprot:XP_001611047.1 lactate dehydrogenase [Babesia bovis T2Bo]
MYKNILSTMAPVIKRNKISLIGSGNIGGVMAYLAQLKELGDVVLFDIAPKLGAAKALDIMHANAIYDTSQNVIGTTSYEDIAGSDVCIITAGLAKLPNKSDDEWSRDDLVAPNSKIMFTIGENIKKYAPNAFVICITNPLDVMVKMLLKSTGFPKNKVVGMGGLLDSSRMCHYIADKLRVNPRYVHGSCIGGHGDSMIPLTNHVTVNGIPIQRFIERGEITQAELDKIAERTIGSGMELVQLYGNGSAFFAPATAAIEMASAYLSDKRSVIVCSCYLEGEYGHNDVYLGTPAIIGANGIEKIITLKLSAEEQAKLDASVKEIRRLEALVG